MKFPSTSGEIVTISADQKQARQCYVASLKASSPNSELSTPQKSETPSTPQGHVMHLQDDERYDPVDVDPRDDSSNHGPKPVEKLIKLQLGERHDQCTNISAELAPHEHQKIFEVLHANRDLFAWKPSDMPGIHPSIISHKLTVCPQAKPVAQRKRRMGEELRAVVKTEVKKLLDAQFIREVRYSTWLANVVMVKKANGKWRMCTDYTHLNKACPKDAYPLPSIDKLVDGASGFNFLSFLDAYSGYNQIRMHPPDEEKTAFITEDANYCYQVMPLGLKNAGATYQRLMDKVFRNQIGRNVEVYVDDMVVKSQSIDQHATDLAKVFAQVRKYNMRLNPEKCTFGVEAANFWAS